MKVERVNEDEQGHPKEGVLDLKRMRGKLSPQADSRQRSRKQSR